MVFFFLLTLFIAPQLWLPPFVGFRVDYLVYPFWVLVAVVTGKWQKIGWTPFDTLFLVFIAQITVGIILTGFRDDSLTLIITYCKFFLLYRLTVSSTLEFPGLRRALIAYSGCVAFLIVESISHKLSPTGIGWAGQPLSWVDITVREAGGTGRTSWIGIFDGPGVFCVLFTTALPFFMIWIQKPRPILMRLTALMFVAADLVATYFNGSRGGLLATIAVIVLFVLLKQPQVVVMMKRLMIVVPVVIVVFMALPSHLTNMNDTQNSASHRVEMWAEGLEMFQQNPLFGIGLGNFRRYTSKLIAHNSAIQLMGELGFPGLFCWFGMIYVTVKSLWRVHSQTKDLKTVQYARGLLLAVVGYFVSSMFVTLEYETLYLLMALGIAFVRGSGTPIEFKSGDVKLVVGTVVLWFIFLKLFVVAYFA